MIKKILLSFLMALVVFCGINLGTTTAYATEVNGTESATLTGNEKLAHVTLSDLFPTGYTSNDKIEITDGDNEIGTLTVDKNADYGFSVYVFKSGGLYTFKPSNDYNVKKFIYVAPTGGSVLFSLVSDQPSSTYMSIEKPTTAEKELINASFPNVKYDSYNAHGVVIDSSYYNDTQNPYVFKHSGTLKFGDIFLIYEESGNYTKTHDCTTDKSYSSPATVKVGDATFLIRYDGTFYGGYPARATGGAFSITIYPVPGNVINYVIFTSPTDNPLDTSELKFSEGLEATYDNGNLKVTGMQPGQTYTINSDGGAEGLLTTITVNYQEHEHSAPYTSGSDETYHFDQCVCLWRVNEKEHTYGEGTQTSEPTSKKPGTIEYTCSTCNYVKKEAVAPNLADTVVELTRKEFKYNGDGLVAAINNLYYKGEKVSSSNYKTTGTTLAKTPGTYSFTIIPAVGSIFVGEKVVTFTIEKGDYDMSKVVFEDMTVDYNGSAQSILATNLPKGVTVTYENNEQTDAGEYTIIAKFTLNTDDAQYYNPIENLTATLTINKATYNMDGVVFAGKTVTYNGNAQSLAIEGVLPNGVTVTYENNGKTDAGEYVVTAKFTGDADNYEFIADKTATLTIEKAVVTAPTADSTAFTYNGQAQTYALQENSFYTISNTTFTNAGSYNITVALKDKNNYQWKNGNSNDIEYSFVINKATYNMDGVVFKDKMVTYNGSEFSIEATNLPNGVTVTYENNVGTNAGTYNAIAKFTGDANNYELIANKTAVLTIKQVVVTAPIADDTVFTYNGQEQTYVLETSSLYNVLDNTATIAGNHTVKVALKDKNNYKWNNGNSNDIEYSFVINKATYNMDGVVFEDKTVTYNGNAQSLAIEGVLPNGVSVTYENNGKTDAGVYTVTAIFTGNENYNEIPNKIATLTINKATYDMSGVVFADKTVTYNGSAFSIEATNLPSGVTASYENNGKMEAGEYVVTAIFTGNANYNTIANKTATLTINKATYDMSGVVFADKTVTYDGNAFSIEATNLPSGVTVAYENNGKTDVGEYTITAIFTGNANYNVIANKTATLTINKATYDMSGVVFADKTVTYNGNAFSIEATNLPTGVTASYENNGKTNAGEYVVTAIFTGNANYNAIANKTSTLTIEQAVVTAPTADSTAFTYNGQAQTYALQENSHYTISDTTFTNAGNHTITVSLVDKTNYKWDNGNSNDLTYSFEINKATYDMSGVVFEDKTVVYNGNEFTIVATNIPTGVSVTYENNDQTNAGEYTITAIFTGNENYNAIANKTATLTINKATYDMSAVVFADKTVTYNGSAFSIEATNLPTGVTVAYENNDQTNAGVYTITAIFTGNANYNAIADMTATLTIKNASLIFNTDIENEISGDVTISAPDGIDPTKELVVEKVEATKNYSEFIDKNQKVAIAYDIKLLKDGATVQPDGTLQFKVLIPEELRGKDFSIIHIHNGNETSVIEYQIDGDYVVFESDKLSDFVFVYDMGSMLWLIIVLTIVALLEIGFLVFLSNKKNAKNRKLASVYPPFVFGMFLAKWQLALVIILAVVVVTLTVISTVYTIKVFSKKN